MAEPLPRFVFDSELMALDGDGTDHDTIMQTDPFGDWEQEWVEEANHPSAVASGSQSSAMTTGARKQTVVDPLTTSLLAEVSRRKPTAEIDRSTLDKALGESKKR